MRARSLTAVATATVLTSVVVAALAVCVVFGPAWIVGEGSGLTAAERLAAQNDVRSTLLQGFGGFLALGGVALGAVMTLRQVRANRDGHSIELFTKAIDMLASDQVSVRHGGVYALEQLAEADERYRGHAHALLTAFVRRHAPWPPKDAETDPATQPLHGGTFDDIGAALAALSRQTASFEGESELERVDLRGAELNKLNLSRVCFAHSNLDGAICIDTKLSGATISDTTLRNTNLTRTDLRGADLTEADLTNANLTDADLTHADLTDADLTNADFTGALLDGTILLGANLTNAHLNDATLRDIVADHTTTWPRDFTPSPKVLRGTAGSPRPDRIHETNYYIE